MAKSPNWLREEIALIEAMVEIYTPKQISVSLKRQLGTKRTPAAIRVKLCRMGYLTDPTLNNYTASYAASLLGISAMTVQRWIRVGWLKARREGERDYRITCQALKECLGNLPKHSRDQLNHKLDSNRVKYAIGEENVSK